jgi:hypothetical protein
MIRTRSGVAETQRLAPGRLRDYKGRLVSTTPGDRPPEDPEELDATDVVAQQAAAHTPKPRAKVELENQTIVIQAEVEAENQRELVPYTAGSTDSTVVVRDRREAAALLRGAGERRPVAGSVALWIGLGALAFAIGGGVALLSGKKAATSALPTQSPSNQPAPLAATPSSTSLPAANSVAAGSTEETPGPIVEPATSASGAAAPELSPSELPKMSHEKRRAEPDHARTYVAPRRPSAPPHATTQPEKGGIPSSI